jgi:hypothetical protein
MTATIQQAVAAMVPNLEVKLELQSEEMVGRTW